MRNISKKYESHDLSEVHKYFPQMEKADESPMRLVVLI